MHEMAICESIRAIIEEQAQEQHFNRVERISLEIGRLAGVDIDALRFGFDVAMKGSVAETAHLEIHELPATAWCLPCARIVKIGGRLEPCPHCGSHQLQVTAGEEMRIREMEVN